MAESASASSTGAREGFAVAARLYQQAGQPYWVERSLAQAAAA